MTLREKMSQMRREYRTEADRLDRRIDEIESRVDQGLQKVGLQMQAIRDQAAATVEAIDQVRADSKDLGRTLTGRSRLLEERFGTMLDLVQATLDEELSDVHARLDRLEKKNDSAA